MDLKEWTPEGSLQVWINKIKHSVVWIPNHSLDLSQDQIRGEERVAWQLNKVYEPNGSTQGQ